MIVNNSLLRGLIVNNFFCVNGKFNLKAFILLTFMPLSAAFFISYTNIIYINILLVQNFYIMQLNSTQGGYYYQSFTYFLHVAMYFSAKVLSLESGYSLMKP